MRLRGTQIVLGQLMELARLAASGRGCALGGMIGCQSGRLRWMQFSLELLRLLLLSLALPRLARSQRGATSSCIHLDRGEGLRIWIRLRVWVLGSGLGSFTSSYTLSTGYYIRFWSGFVDGPKLKFSLNN